MMRRRMTRVPMIRLMITNRTIMIMVVTTTTTKTSMMMKTTLTMAMTFSGLWYLTRSSTNSRTQSLPESWAEYTESVSAQEVSCC